ncbi:hypothetical protein RBSH_02143 [Rhodopirellula baltica SH28]|uniref:Secreted protein n=1 Tax=Rhodopirellula baltica SH28 TaxID=993517 RepID=K5DI45_RHOBT|nr:hypothetical protein RBSH_02143 [Rhodopirellula baltica SH28]
MRETALLTSFTIQREVVMGDDSSVVVFWAVLCCHGCPLVMQGNY